MDVQCQVIKRVETWVRGLFAANLAVAHDWLHVDRVRRNILVIAGGEGVDPWLAEIAALIHDVGRTQPGPEAEHGARSAVLAAPLLAGLPLPADQREAILFAVRWHSSLRTDTLLLCVLRDADMLDGMGAIGLMRAFMSKSDLPAYDAVAPFADSFTRPPATVADQIRFQMSWQPVTPTGQEMARQRLAFMHTFVEQIQSEIDGAG
ncbi:MAG: HD domain-containing protein [Anaerolineae bacterium]|nr:HD domain-containing protein [Anaerolineae bacterium]